MCCPYFVPNQHRAGELWPWRRRLPLGDGFLGCCSAPGHEGEEPDEEALKQCNLGYARCVWLPAVRLADAVRFSVESDSGVAVRILYVMELNHLPGEHGTLEFSRATSSWLTAHPDERLQRKAECFLAAYLSRRQGSES